MGNFIHFTMAGNRLAELLVRKTNQEKSAQHTEHRHTGLQQKQ
jgi:hypothetical protein